MSTIDPASLNEYDPTLPETFDSVHATFADLRARCPVAHSTQFDGFWTLAKYEDIVNVLRDSDMYITSVRNVVPGSSTTGRRPPLHLNPPEHTPYRRAIDRALSASRVASLLPSIQRIALELATDLVARGDADLVEHFSAVLPVRLFGGWLGLTEAQTEHLATSSRAYIKAWEAFDKPGVVVAGEGLASLARELIELRRVQPLDPTVDPDQLIARRTRYRRQPVPGCSARGLRATGIGRGTGRAAHSVREASPCICRAIRNCNGNCARIDR